jgi:hypothetical protein
MKIPEGTTYTEALDPLVSRAEAEGVEALPEAEIKTLIASLRFLRLLPNPSDEDCELTRRVAGVLGITNDQPANFPQPGSPSQESRA